MSYAGNIQRYSGQAGAVMTQPTPQSVLSSVLDTAIGASDPTAYIAAANALAKCPNVFDAVYQLDPAQLEQALKTWAAGTMGPITADNICQKLDQFRQDLNNLQSPAPPAPAAPGAPEQQPVASKSSTKAIWLLGGLIVVLGGVAVWSSMKGGGVRSNPMRSKMNPERGGSGWFIDYIAPNSADVNEFGEAVHGRMFEVGPFHTKRAAKSWMEQQMAGATQRALFKSSVRNITGSPEWRFRKRLLEEW